MEKDEHRSHRSRSGRLTHHDEHRRRSRRKKHFYFFLRCVASLVMFAFASYLLFGSFNDEWPAFENILLALALYGGCVFILLKRNSGYIISGSVFKR